MPRATTPPPTAPRDSASATPSTPSGNPQTTMPTTLSTPTPFTPSHRRIVSHPRTPHTSPLTICSSSPSAFTLVRVHTAKCSECDARNKDVMRRCPGCTFQVCKPCQEKRERSGKDLAHGNMVSPRVATPGTGGSVVRRRPVGVVLGGGRGGEKRVEEKETSGGLDGEKRVEEKETSGGLEGEGDVMDLKGKKRALEPAVKPKPKPKPKPKSKLKSKLRDATPSDQSSDEDFTLDPASPTANKRRRTDFIIASPADLPSVTGSNIKSASSTTEKMQELASKDARRDLSAQKLLSNMTTDELLAHYDVNTSSNPYNAHLLSRHEPVVSNPVIQIPEVVKRRFKSRPSAEEIQQNIQDRVREKMGLPVSTRSQETDE